MTLFVRMGIFPKFSLGAGLGLQSIKLACFQQSVLSDCVEFCITALVTRLLFYLAGSGASSPLTSPSSPTPPSTAGKLKSHYNVCSVLFVLTSVFNHRNCIVPKDD